MLNTLPSTVAIVLALGLAQDPSPAGWMAFSSKPGRFSVSVPATPTEKPQFVGQQKVTRFIAEDKNKGVYVISFSDYPDADLKKDLLQKRLDQARDGAVASVNGMLKAEKAIQLEGHPGRELAIESAGVVIVRMRMFVVDRRLYQVLVLGPAPILASKEITFFLDSFRLIK